MKMQTNLHSSDTVVFENTEIKHFHHATPTPINDDGDDEKFAINVDKVCDVNIVFL